jgi:hypothetical protein
MKRSFDVLAARGFLVALAVLLLNDFVLNPAFGNAFTGKLSDFAGLFAFSVFWMAVFPRRRWVVCAATAAAFVAWKSAAAQPLIDLWNAWMPLTVGRTVDATDLVALVWVAAAYRYAGNGTPAANGFAGAVGAGPRLPLRLRGNELHLPVLVPEPVRLPSRGTRAGGERRLAAHGSVPAGARMGRHGGAVYSGRELLWHDERQARGPWRCRSDGR